MRAKTLGLMFLMTACGADAAAHDAPIAPGGSSASSGAVVDEGFGGSSTSTGEVPDVERSSSSTTSGDCESTCPMANDGVCDGSLGTGLCKDECHMDDCADAKKAWLSRVSTSLGRRSEDSSIRESTRSEQRYLAVNRDAFQERVDLFRRQHGIIPNGEVSVNVPEALKSIETL